MTTNEKMKTKVTLPSDTELLITRTFDAPRELVWKAYTQAEHLKHWWGPKGWTLPVCEMDFREGGSWFYCMEGPDGMRSCGKTIFKEIDAPNRYVAEDTFVDNDGNPMEGMPVALMTTEFHEENGMTTVKSITRYPTKEQRDQVVEMGVEEGINQTLDRLEDYLKQGIA